MAKKNYSELLRDPRWQKRRLEIMARDEWACQSCKCKTDTLNVHHKRYQWGLNPWEYPDDDLITLCEGCHEFEEDLKTITIYNDLSSVSGLLNIQLWLYTNALVYAKLNNPDVFEQVKDLLKSSSIDMKDDFNKFIGNPKGYKKNG
jgi:hypothetical protein